MQVAAGALSPLIRKLGDMLVSEFTRGSRVKKGVKSLQTELQLMYVFLHKVGDMPVDELDPQVRIWAGKVRELSYNMEDAVDAYMVRVYDGGHGALGPNNMKNKLKKFVRRTKKLFSKGMALHHISSAVQDAHELSKELGELRQRYALEVRTDGAENTIDPRLKAVYRDITELVGIEGTRDELIKKLLQGDEMSKQKLKTLSIVGFGGLGKTTLARSVYDKIRAQFDCGLFVTVSWNPAITKNFKKMLYGLGSTKFANINEAVVDDEQLINELRAFLEDKRYLIVIDDIWGEEAWEIIKCAFSNSDLGSRVITTTHITSVSEACYRSSRDIIHKMKPLDNDCSIRLFYKRIFPQGSECPDELEQVSTKILKKCGGVPLVIITIASLLANNDQQIKPKYQWDNILNSIGRGLAEGATAKDMRSILSFSYYVPSHLKSCLLYLSIFPEDYDINRDRLIWKWIAEGLIQGGEQEIRLFELGERNFSELINRNLIRPAYVDDEGRVRSCRVHDMVLDLICSLSCRENFVTILDETKQCRNSSDSMIRILSLQNSNSGINTHLLDTTSMLKLRSVTLFRTDVDMMKALPRFQLLRVLDLEDCNIGESSHQIYLRYVENLLHLKYLGLRNTHVGVLPMEIGKLQLLQTLDLRTRVVVEVPSSVVELKRLMCLYVDNGMRLPVGIGNLVLLEELGCVKVGGTDAIEKELGNLKELRVLGLFWEGDAVCDLLLLSLTNLKKLHTLYIDSDGDARFNVSWARWVPPPHLHTFRFRGCTSTLPTWIKHSFFPVLCCLYIYVDRVRLEVDIQMLGTLRALRFLWVETTTAQCSLVERFVIADDAFPCLRQCRFYNFQTWPSMFPQGPMPRLESLRFHAQASHIASGHLDVDMRHLLSLQEVKVYLWTGKHCLPAVNTATDVLKHALDAHPNRPTLSLHQIPLPE